jgi:hypothetical protein
LYFFFGHRRGRREEPVQITTRFCRACHHARIQRIDGCTLLYVDAKVSEISEKRLSAFRRRFPNREELSLQRLHAEFFSEFGQHECMEVLQLLASELAIPAGMLRPSDKIRELLEPIHSGNPLRWIEEWTRAAKRATENHLPAAAGVRPHFEAILITITPLPDPVRSDSPLPPN